MYHSDYSTRPATAAELLEASKKLYVQTEFLKRHRVDPNAPRIFKTPSEEELEGMYQNADDFTVVDIRPSNGMMFCVASRPTKSGARQTEVLRNSVNSAFQPLHKPPPRPPKSEQLKMKKFQKRTILHPGSKNVPFCIPEALQFGDEVRSSKRSNKFKKKGNGRDKANTYADDMNKCLYEELPENTFTRTISNPEVVMKRQREQKIDQKLKELGERGLVGGSLKVYCEELDPNRPYVSVLVGPLDSADKVLLDAVEKFSFGTLDHREFVLVEIQQRNGRRSERVLLLDECPAVIIAKNNSCG
uniref:Ras-associating domain-containing protein n=1 Tax=Bursaphelenchus xylophilus TaxID=6326 RepID=A0A1I7SGS5_BURXY